MTGSAFVNCWTGAVGGLLAVANTAGLARRCEANAQSHLSAAHPACQKGQRTAPPGKCRQFGAEDGDAVLASRCRSAFFS
jgi:hypothetical protein